MGACVSINRPRFKSLRRGSRSGLFHDITRDTSSLYRKNFHQKGQAFMISSRLSLETLSISSDGIAEAVEPSSSRRYSPSLRIQQTEAGAASLSSSRPMILHLPGQCDDSDDDTTTPIAEHETSSILQTTDQGSLHVAYSKEEIPPLASSTPASKTMVVVVECNVGSDEQSSRSVSPNTVDTSDSHVSVAKPPTTSSSHTPDRSIPAAQYSMRYSNTTIPTVSSASGTTIPISHNLTKKVSWFYDHVEERPRNQVVPTSRQRILSIHENQSKQSPTRQRASTGYNNNRNQQNRNATPMPKAIARDYSWCYGDESLTVTTKRANNRREQKKGFKLSSTGKRK